ncbi:molybdopterin-guanine dinucleotide biosynthesis protein MobB [Motiliproteus sp. SC1-56]|uniref:molybdopterin-guanine dinucleotide biosynthesis protein MobB n=1 Tax=Motiliproteus sp. SC1-56 TaxID=2799565 RepID=UPI001A901C22|nr:molybdopterin-guanine dinucleotide biosynthesis protein MobB [Motiliproteus sp. SC1-56]
MTITSPLPLIGFAAFSGTGKTTLLKKLIPLLRARGIRVGVIKHAHHRFDVDSPGKDSYALREAGATQMLLGSCNRWALMTETPELQADPDLNYLISRLDTDTLDMILVEGFKHLPFPKIELQRPALNKPLLFPDDPHVVAVATDAALPKSTPLPLLDINDAHAIAAYIIDYCKLDQPLQEAL